MTRQQSIKQLTLNYFSELLKMLLALIYYCVVIIHLLVCSSTGALDVMGPIIASHLTVVDLIVWYVRHILTLQNSFYSQYN